MPKLSTKLPGADVSVMPEADCKAIDLFNSPYPAGLASGVTGGTTTTLLYQGKVEVDGGVCRL